MKCCLVWNRNRHSNKPSGPWHGWNLIKMNRRVRMLWWNMDSAALGETDHFRVLWLNEFQVPWRVNISWKDKRLLASKNNCASCCLEVTCPYSSEETNVIWVTYTVAKKLVLQLPMPAPCSSPLYFRMGGVFFSCGATAPSGSWPPHSWGFLITHSDASQSVGLLWTSDQVVAETST